ncbi:sensor histidine kinase [Pelagovum pacificum]|uniref:histidine kinase n=1 Tax=Pelagovum pacificum TaxID=2588711 RepID=A0A5C5GB34_9RHOB|nr:hybrid sensor histidine kinase/response regulator [Pelagovum pacificum]QQA42181.1 hybrid sensor histidine kinase/response regulator [Pelagovum pacificum]TNY31267.1 hybrid sensor histidine kinase/response regulator [Pelagovum pacificum]
MPETRSSLVLVIDDDDADRKLIRRLLHSAEGQFEVTEARTAEEARAVNVDPDAVLLDNSLPGSEGLHLLSSLAERWPKAALILTTGQGSEDIAKSSIQRGATDYVPKRDLGEGMLKDLLETSVRTARAAFRQKERQAELSIFSEVLVHDFRAPIRGIHLLLDRLEGSMSSGVRTDIAGDLHQLRQTSDQMAALVDSLAAHIRHDQLVHPEVADIGTLARDALTTLRADIEECGAKVDLQAGETRFSCLVPQVRQLFQNLIGNALKYVSDIAPQIRIEVCQNKAGIGASVADNGPGIPPAHHEVIFEPFRRGSNGRGAPGTGLGLATCRKIVQRHGGRIWCESTPGQGATFYFTLTDTSG